MKWVMRKRDTRFIQADQHHKTQDTSAAVGKTHTSLRRRGIHDRLGRQWQYSRGERQSGGVGLPVWAFMSVYE